MPIGGTSRGGASSCIAFSRDGMFHCNRNAAGATSGPATSRTLPDLTIRRILRCRSGGVACRVLWLNVVGAGEG